MLKEHWTVSDTPIDDPIDGIDLTDLDGWTYSNDSSRMCKKNNGKGLEGNSGDRYQDSWIRFDNS